MKIFFRRIHLYLSLAAGLVILIACLTGAILVFEKDLQMALNKDRYYVPPQGQRLPLDTLAARVKTAFPAMQVTSVKVYEAAGRSAEIGISPAKPKGDKKENGDKGKAGAAGQGPAKAAEKAPAGR
ncbi:MAG TPA: PepSY domain-containing protein, partial [Chitinophagaceae bacterium]|nr:PepSY domain-containing protein [Chitinophagaceae bacterium]